MTSQETLTSPILLAKKLAKDTHIGRGDLFYTEPLFNHLVRVEKLLCTYAMFNYDLKVLAYLQYLPVIAGVEYATIDEMFGPEIGVKLRTVCNAYGLPLMENIRQIRKQPDLRALMLCTYTDHLFCFRRLGDNYTTGGKQMLIMTIIGLLAAGEVVAKVETE